MHLNSGAYFTLPARMVFLFKEYEDEYLQRMAAFRDACTTVIGDAEIKICVENTGGDFAPVRLHGADLLLENNAFAHLTWA